VTNKAPTENNLTAKNQFSGFENTTNRNLNFSMHGDPIKHDVIA